MRYVKGFTELRTRSGMTWIAEQHGWAAAPDDILDALSSDGFEECKRAMTTSRGDSRPAGGLWQGIDPRTGSVASAIWVNRPRSQHAIVFVEIDGETLAG